ncbi:MAG: aminotransferase class I/II-fold pyridoxal phosphate-dependent enzyme [Bacteroidales bacterium]|nr:aminotransferase class I/II-fold pyridoxal phosphate-dependent enzyme [Bacteroidales bacterium]
MNILLINHYAGSPKMGMEFRPFYLSREWVRQGHNVYIISADYSHVRKKNPEVENDFQTEQIEGVTYIWVKTREYKSNGISRLFNIFDFNKKLLLNVKKIVTICNPDLVIASSTYPYDNLVAHKIAKRAKAKHIYEVHDLWPLSPIELYGYSKFHPFILLTQYFEDYAYRKAHKVVSLLPKAKDYMVSRGMKPEKFICIPNGVLKEDWENCTDELPYEHFSKIDNIKRKGKKIVGYAGSHGQAYSLNNLLDAAQKLEGECSLHFVLVGSGLDKENLVRKYSVLSNVSFLPPVEKSQIPELLSKFDICYLGLQPASLFKFGISPNKLMDYMMASKPIISAIDAGNNPVLEAKCGYSVKPDDVEALVSVLKGVSFLSDLDLEILGRNGRKYILENYEYKKLSRDFLKLVSDYSTPTFANIPFSPPHIDQDIIDEVTNTLKSGWITTGPKVKEFEKLLAEFCHSKGVLAVNSATAGMELVLRWFGVGPGDEVIVPAYTFTATASVVCHCGAKPVIVDINKNDFVISVNEIIKNITPRTKVIMPVDIGGFTCDYDSILKIVSSTNIVNQFSANNDIQKKLGRILVLADAAHSLGAIYKGKRVGSLCDISVFSFHAVKNLTTAEGGAISFNLPDNFNQAELYTKLNQIILHGQSRDAFAKYAQGDWRYDVMSPGYKMNMTDIAASIGVIEIKRYQESTLKRRAEIYERYLDNFSKYEWAITKKSIDKDSASSFHLFMLRIKDASEEHRDRIIKQIFAKGVSANVHFLPLPMLSAYKDLGFSIADYPNAYNMYKNEITLPLYFNLTNEQVDYVCNVVAQAVAFVKSDFMAIDDNFYKTKTVEVKEQEILIND